MIEGLRPYPAYKESGSTWLGRVPERWATAKLKHVVTFTGGGTPSKSNAEFWGGTIPWVSPKDMRSTVIRDTEDHITDAAIDASATHRIAPGALLLVTRSGILRRRIPVAVNAVTVTLNQDMKALRSRGTVLIEYLRDVVLGNEAMLLLEWSKQGATVESIEHTYLANSLVPVPPLAEQRAIVRFLDYADRRIRKYIASKRKLIALLEEEKRAIIDRAVTRGLDPNVRLKDSGVPWIGMVPEDWEVRRIKQAAKILRGKFTHRPRNDPSLYDGKYPFIQTGAVARAKNLITNYTQTLNEKGLAVSKMFPRGTLVMTIAANIGDVALLDFDACFPDSIVGFVPLPDVDRDFLYFCFVWMKPELLREAPVNTQGNLNVERIGGMRIPLPPLDEQRKIVRFVEESTAALGAEVERIDREISLLREFRTRIISDVVTGKLDVREAAVHLPEESAVDATDDAPLDDADTTLDTDTLDEESAA